MSYREACEELAEENKKLKAENKELRESLEIIRKAQLEEAISKP